MNGQVTRNHRGLPALHARKYIRVSSDTLIRHKWPEEKPEPGIEKRYIVRIEYEEDGKMVSEITTDKWNKFTWYEYLEDYITHWWNLPEVEE